ncbi:MAG TPA: PsbP-related protein [Nocardioidaceae bacterium]|nr:PsbP-related protein [Nocardioidaceae bacterium]
MLRHLPPVLDRRPAVTALAALAVLTVGGCGSTEERGEAASSESTSEATEPSESAEEVEPSDDASTDPEQVPTGSVAGDGYTLAVPEGWTDLSGRDKEVPELAQADLAYGDTTEQEFASNLNTIVTPAGGETVSDPGVRQRLADQVEQAINVRPTPVADLEFDGEKAIGQTATVRRPDATLIQYVTVHEDEVYTLTVTLSAARAEESDAIVGDIVDSWRWTDS